MRYWIFLVASIGLWGCAENQQYFRPTENVMGRTMRGEAEAIYALAGPFGPFGEAKVWSSGAFREHGNTVVHVTLQLHNTSGVAIEIDPAQAKLDPVRVGSELLHNIAPLEKQTLSVAPGAFGEVRLHYLLPSDVVPGRVSSFGLRWQVRNGPQTYSQLTPFLERGGYRHAYPYPPVYGYGFGYFCSPYDPFCGPYYGFGFYSRPVIVGPPPHEGYERHPRATIRTR